MHDFAFLSQNTFLRAPTAQPGDGRRYGIAGLAWDGATTHRPGARFGPDSIRRASHMLCDGVHPLLDVSPAGCIADLGDLPLPNTGLDAMRCAARWRARCRRCWQRATWSGSAAITR